MKIKLENMQLVPLIDMPEFIEECIELLNEPPLSIILLEKENKLIGHARLCPLPQNGNGCWIESVVIWKNLRGKGFGRTLMKGIEMCAKEFGFKE
uniref:N-acetyltransferase domain-containing protein n=1 Tax=Meloidogyne javanica TaxID=6303 RepID=A0A915MJE4_MELJA